MLHTDALRQVLQDYDDIRKTSLYIGRQEGFLDGQKDDIGALAEEFKGKVLLGSVASVVKQFCKEVPGLVG